LNIACHLNKPAIMKPIYTIILSPVIFLFVTTLYAQPHVNDFVLRDKTVQQFLKAEWDIHLSAAYTNQYNQKDIVLDMLLTSPCGKTDCFTLLLRRRRDVTPTLKGAVHAL
jgi:hypothetical protein